MLPDGWNTTPNLYILRYKSTATSDIYILKVLSVDNSLLVHFWVRQEECDGFVCPFLEWFWYMSVGVCVGGGGDNLLMNLKFLPFCVRLLLTS